MLAFAAHEVVDISIFGPLLRPCLESSAPLCDPPIVHLHWWLSLDAIFALKLPMHSHCHHLCHFSVSDPHPSIPAWHVPSILCMHAHMRAHAHVQSHTHPQQHHTPHLHTLPPTHPHTLTSARHTSNPHHLPAVIGFKTESHNKGSLQCTGGVQCPAQVQRCAQPHEQCQL